MSRTIGIGLILCLSLAACSQRSTEAFCATMRSEKARILNNFNLSVQAADASGDDLVSVMSKLGASVSALGELRVYFNKLAKVAPDEIQTEVEVVAELMDKQLAAGTNVSNPLGALAGSVMTGLQMQGPLNAVDGYARTHCGEGI